MKKGILLFMALFGFFSCKQNQEKSLEGDTTAKKTTSNYVTSRAPLKETPYLELPLGTIKPDSWLKDQLQRMADGMTGNLDEIYPEVVGPRNGWLGGDGDGWERGHLLDRWPSPFGIYPR